MEKGYYLPLEDEPCVFTDKAGKINQHWIEECRPILLGVAIDQGLKKLDALEDFFNSPVNLNYKPAKNDKPRVGDAAVLMVGNVLAAEVRDQLNKGIPLDLFPPPRLLTSKGSISMRWVMYVANTEKMTPEEAFTYGTSLAIRKD